MLGARAQVCKYQHHTSTRKRELSGEVRCMLVPDHTPSLDPKKLPLLERCLGLVKVYVSSQHTSRWVAVYQ